MLNQSEGRKEKPYILPLLLLFIGAILFVLQFILANLFGGSDVYDDKNLVDKTMSNVVDAQVSTMERTPLALMKDKEYYIEVSDERTTFSFLRDGELLAKNYDNSNVEIRFSKKAEFTEYQVKSGLIDYADGVIIYVPKEKINRIK